MLPTTFLAIVATVALYGLTTAPVPPPMSATCTRPCSRCWRSPRSPRWAATAIMTLHPVPPRASTTPRTCRPSTRGACICWTICSSLSWPGYARRPAAGCSSASSRRYPCPRDRLAGESLSRSRDPGRVHAELDAPAGNATGGAPPSAAGHSASSKHLTASRFSSWSVSTPRLRHPTSPVRAVPSPPARTAGRFPLGRAG